MNTSRWDICWGRSPAELADEYERTWQVRYRKAGGYDMRYRASRFVKRVREANKAQAPQPS